MKRKHTDKKEIVTELQSAECINHEVKKKSKKDKLKVKKVQFDQVNEIIPDSFTIKAEKRRSLKKRKKSQKHTPDGSIEADLKETKLLEVSDHLDLIPASIKDTEVKKSKKDKNKSCKSLETCEQDIVMKDNNTQQGVEDSQSVKNAKRKQKSKKKQEKSSDNITDDQTTSSDEMKPDAGKEALHYLNLWKTDRKSWAFRKVRQVWLLKNMYKPEKINDDDFEVLLEYMEGLQGKAKERTIKKTEELMEKGEKESLEKVEASRDETTDGNTESVLTRVRQVLQILN